MHGIDHVDEYCTQCEVGDVLTKMLRAFCSVLEKKSDRCSTIVSEMPANPKKALVPQACKQQARKSLPHSMWFEGKYHTVDQVLREIKQSL